MEVVIEIRRINVDADLPSLLDVIRHMSFNVGSPPVPEFAVLI